MVPKTSISALFPVPVDCGYGVSVYPLTLGHYALLEKINSYLVNGDHAPDSLEVIKTLYICTHSAKDIIQDFDNIDVNAMEWAETLPPRASKNIVPAILAQIDVMSKVAPVVGDDKKKVAEMDT